MTAVIRMILAFLKKNKKQKQNKQTNKQTNKVIYAGH